MKLLALVALLLALSVTPTADATSRSRHSGVLYGLVTRGPACTGQPAPCGEPVPGVKIVFLRLGHPVGQATTTNAGTYRVRLRAGNYGIRLPGRSQWEPTRTRVWPGRMTRINIAIDALNG